MTVTHRQAIVEALERGLTDQELHGIPLVQVASAICRALRDAGYPEAAHPIEAPVGRMVLRAGAA